MRFSKNAKTLFNRSACFFLLALAGSSSAYAAPKRVVTLIPSLGELASEILESTDTIVGVSEFTDYPAALKTKKTIGPYYKVNLEAVVELRPDLVLASTDGNLKDQIDRLRELKIPVVVVKTSRMREIEESITQVSEALGKAEKGKTLLARFKRDVQSIRDRAKKRKSLRVLLQVGDEPLVVVGGESFLSEALEVVGAKNAYSDSKLPYPRIAYEDVVKRNPDRILVFALSDDRAVFEKMAKQWERFPGLKSIRNKGVTIFKADELLRPGSRLIRGLELLERELYGEK